MTRFSGLFDDVFLKLLLVGTVGRPSVILSVNPWMAMKVPSGRFSGFWYCNEHLDFYRSHLYRESFVNIENFTFECFFRDFSPCHL